MKKRMGKMEILAEAASMCNVAETRPIFLNKWQGNCVKMNHSIEHKVPNPGIDFVEIFKGSKYRLVSQRYNGDGTYGIIVEADVLKNDTHEKDGVCRIEARRVVVRGNEIIAIPDWYKLDWLK